MHRSKLIRTKLGSVDLSDANLRHANLSSATLNGANLNGTHLFGANLSDAQLSGADLSEANLSEADLSGANLSDAILRGAVLHGAKLREAASLSGIDLNGAAIDEVDRNDARVAIELKASAKAEISPKLPNPDRNSPPRPDGIRGPMRRFGGPLRLYTNVVYTTDEETVLYIQRAKSVLVVKLILPCLILVALIAALFYFTALEVYIAIAIFVMFFVIFYLVINYIDDIYILTSKRVIDIDRKFIFLDKEHLSIEYGQIKNVRVVVRNPIYLAMDIGSVIVETPGNNPDIVMDLVNHPFSIQDKIFALKRYKEKQEETMMH